MTNELGCRRAVPGDAHALMSLERSANLVALAHVFPPDQYAFPAAQVAARWTATLADPAVTVEVVEDAAGMAAYVAHDDTLLRHLAVRPDTWGTGLGRRLVTRAAQRMAAEPRLWCLADNHRALAFYRHLGWQPTGASRPAEWPPHPVELELSLAQTPRMRSSAAASRATTARPSSSRMIGR
jgi:putative acetyltransferase